MATTKEQAPAQFPASLVESLMAFQAARPRILKDSDNSYFGNKYASLDQFEAATIPMLAAQGLAWSCEPRLEASDMILRWRLTHHSGEERTGDWPIGIASPQQMGAAITYGRRYCLSAVIGVAADDDDDGNTANTPIQRQAPAQVKPTVITWDAMLNHAATLDLDELRRLHRSAGVDKAPEPVRQAFMGLVERLKAPALKPEPAPAPEPESAGKPCVDCGMPCEVGYQMCAGCRNPNPVGDGDA